MVDKVKKREISELDEFIDVFNKTSEKITMCRYALNQDILLTIINTSLKQCTNKMIKANMY